MWLCDFYDWFIACKMYCTCEQLRWIIPKCAASSLSGDCFFKIFLCNSSFLFLISSIRKGLGLSNPFFLLEKVFKACEIV